RGPERPVAGAAPVRVRPGGGGLGSPPRRPGRGGARRHPPGDRAKPRRGRRARDITAEDLAQMGEVLPVSGRDITALERSAGLFAHWLACPIAPMRLYLLERAGRVRGYFLLASVLAQVRIADCWV